MVPLVCLLYEGKDLEVMKEKGERAEELEVLMQKLERDNESLQKKATSLGITCEKVCHFTVSSIYIRVLVYERTPVDCV